MTYKWQRRDSCNLFFLNKIIYLKYNFSQVFEIIGWKKVMIDTIGTKKPRNNNKLKIKLHYVVNIKPKDETWITMSETSFLYHKSNKIGNTSLAEQFENIIVNLYKQNPNDNTPTKFMNRFLHMYFPCVLI